jgi:hypothetical protein
MSDDSVHTNDKGKYSTAVYTITIRDMFISQDWVRSLFVTYGRSSTYARWTYTSIGETRWDYLITNESQTTRADVVVRLASKLGWSINDPRIVVEVLMAVPERGRSSRQAATTRRGTRRMMKNSSYGTGLSAR